MAQQATSNTSSTRKSESACMSFACAVSLSVFAGCLGIGPATEGAQDPDAREVGVVEQPVILREYEYIVTPTCVLRAEIRSESNAQGAFGEADTFARGDCLGAGASIATTLFGSWQHADSKGWLSSPGLLWAQAQQWGNPFGSEHWVEYQDGYCKYRKHVALNPFGEATGLRTEFLPCP